MSSTLGASLLRTVLSDGTLKILGSGLDKGPIINYLKARKKECWKRTCRIQKRIITIYHREDGVPGYRQMQSYLAQEGILTYTRFARHLK